MRRLWLLGLPITVTVGAVVDSRSLRAWSGTSNLGPNWGPERGLTLILLGNSGAMLPGGGGQLASNLQSSSS